MVTFTVAHAHCRQNEDQKSLNLEVSLIFMVNEGRSFWLPKNYRVKLKFTHEYKLIFTHSSLIISNSFEISTFSPFKF